MSTLYRFAFLSICFLGCSSDVVDENAVPMTNFSAVRDMAVPSPGPLNIPSSGGMPEMIQGGEMVAAGTMAVEMMPDAPGGLPAGGTDDAPEGGSLPTGGAGGERGTPNAGGMEGPVNITVQECTDLYACISGCMDSLPCADRCRDLAGDDVSDVYDAVFSCGRMNGCNDPGGRWNAQCMADSCRVPLEMCFGEPNLPGQAPPVVDPPAEPGSCGALGQCLLACPRNDEICANGCRDGSQPMAIQQWDTYQECITNAVCGVTDHACRRRNCENEYEACFDRMIVQPAGANSCSLYNQCVGACPDNDTACEDNCLAATSAEGYNQSVELGLCLNRSNCEDDDLACLERECMNQIEACFGPLPRGMGTCLELNTCLSDCADDDAACSEACVAATAEAEFEKFQVAIECIRMNCPDGGVACERNLCGPQVEACLGNIAIPAGQGTCGSLNECILACPDNNEACENACVEASSPVAFEQFISYNDCLRNAECADVNYACRRETCSMEGQTCFGRYPVPNGVLTCRQLDACLSVCREGEQACIDGCIDRASPQGFNAHIVLVLCLQDGGLCEAESIACF